MDPLIKYLVELPKRKHFSSEEYECIFPVLYFYATRNGEFIKDIFPQITNSEEHELLIDHNNILTQLDTRLHTFVDDSAFEASNEPFYKRINANPAKYTHDPNKTCSREFKPQEPVYRCDDCGYDDTCVLCSYCFNPLDHIDHNVHLYYSTGESGGICDCGDPEAFTAQLNCKCQIKDDENVDKDDMEVEPELIDSAFEDLLLHTLEIVLDYILDVTNVNASMLRFPHHNFSGKENKVKYFSNHSNLTAAKYGDGKLDENSSTEWHLLLWNDEVHDYPETEKVIRDATGVNASEARAIADKINDLGKDIIQTKSRIEDLFSSQRILESIGLVTTIISARDHARNCIVDSMICWLDHTLDFSNIPNMLFQNKVREILGELLLRHDYELATYFPSEDISQLDDEYKILEECNNSGLLYHNSFLNRCEMKVRAHSKDKRWWFSSTSSVLEFPESIKFYNSRIQYLMLFEIRFDKVIRKKFLSVLGNILISDLNVKSKFSLHYIQAYPTLFKTMAIGDREDHLNFLSEISTQLLTCPQTTRNIIRHFDDAGLAHIAAPLIAVINQSSKMFNNVMGFDNMVDLKQGPRLTYLPVSNAIKTGIRNLGYLIEKKSGVALKDLKKLLQPDNLVILLQLLKFFHGYLDHKRKYGDHVEVEHSDLETHVGVSLPILNIIKYIAQSCLSQDIDLASEVSKFFIDEAMTSLMPMIAPGVANFELSKERVGFIHPINTLISYLILHDGFDSFSVSYSYLQNNINKPFMHISDYSLRSVVFASQIKIGFWIRNGYYLSRMANFYQGGYINETTYYRDIYLNQVAAVIDDPKTTLFNFLERWELYSWFSGVVSYDNTIYEDRFFSISEEFISFIYKIIVDRSNFIPSNNESLSSRQAKSLKLSLCYLLIYGPQQYSALKKALESDLSSYEGFDEVLRSVANYQPPTGMVDSGMYRLKPEYFRELDSIGIHMDSADFQEISEILLKEKAKAYPNKKKHILTPKLIHCDNELVTKNIARFTKTTHFAKLIYKFLQVSIDSKDESYISQLLHLVHAIFLDDANLNGTKSFVSDVFVNIPICDLLLTIVDSTMSESIVNKAEYLLDFMIEADDGIVESLTSCFGEEHINNYISKKAGKSESEAEKRKRISEARKEKVMKKFAKQRESFLAANKDLSDSIKKNKNNQNQEDNATQIDTEEGESDSGRRHCCICGEEEDEERTFGYFVTLNSQEFWRLPNDDLDFAGVSFKDWDQHDMRKDKNEYGKGFHIREVHYKNGHMVKSNYNRSFIGQVITTCGHGIHLSCDPATDITFPMRHHPCPLCDVLYCYLLPSHMVEKGNGGIPSTYLNREPKLTKYNQIIPSVEKKKSVEIMDHMGGALSLAQCEVEDRNHFKIKFARQELDDYLWLRRSDGEFVRKFGDDFSELYNYIFQYGTVISDTIRMHEILTRIDGNDAYSSFLSSFPANIKSVLKAYIIARANTTYTRQIDEKDSNFDLQSAVKKFWNKHEYEKLSGIFSEVVLLYFQTDESFLTLARFGFTKLFAITSYTLLQRAENSREYGKLYNSNGKTPPPKVVLDPLGSIALRYLPNFEGFETEEFLSNLYFTIEKCLLPFLRQMIIFKDILTSTFVGNKEWKSIEELITLEDEISDQQYVDSSAVLCKKLGLLSFDEFIVGLENTPIKTEWDFALEKSTFDIMVNAKIPKFNNKILTLDYPGVTKLADIPDDYGAAIYKPDSEHHNFRVCLICGDVVKVEPAYQLKHSRKCSNRLLIFFNTRSNILEVFTKSDNFTPLGTSFPAPYLTEHGEVRTKSVGKATLNKMRYKYLNKLWLSQGLQGIIFRSFGRSSLAQMNGTRARTTTSDSEDDEDDEFEDDEDDEDGFEDLVAFEDSPF